MRDDVVFLGFEEHGWETFDIAKDENAYSVTIVWPEGSGDKYHVTWFPSSKSAKLVPHEDLEIEEQYFLLYVGVVLARTCVPGR